jgi:3-oxoacyl-[acyl-carrier protein] reductase
MTTSLLDGRRAVVTGGARGIGLQTARTLAEHGARVVLGDRDADEVARAAEALSAEGHEVHGVAGDVTSQQDVDALVAACVDRLGGIDIMVNNAGITRDSTMRKMALEDFQAVIDVHLRGTWLGTKAACAAMREQGTGGAIVNMSSLSGKVGNFGQTNYSAAKAGIVGLTKAAAKEHARLGIRINAIQPGLIRTDMTDAMPRDVFEEKSKEIPLQRAGEPEDVANVVLFLASDLSAYVTGTVVEVTGGRGM